MDRVSELLRQKLKQAELLLAKKEVMSQKRQEALTEQGALEPKLDRLLEKTKELQKLVREGGGPQQDAASPSSLTPAVPEPPRRLSFADRGRRLQALQRAAGEPDGCLPVSPPRTGTHREGQDGVLPPSPSPLSQPWGAGNVAVASLGGWMLLNKAKTLLPPIHLDFGVGGEEPLNPLLWVGPQGDTREVALAGGGVSLPVDRAAPRGP